MKKQIGFAVLKMIKLGSNPSFLSIVLSFPEQSLITNARGHSTERTDLVLANIQNFGGNNYQNQPHIFLRNEPEVHYSPQSVVYSSKNREDCHFQQISQKIGSCVKCILAVLQLVICFNNIFLSDKGFEVSSLWHQALNIGLFTMDGMVKYYGEVFAL